MAEGDEESAGFAAGGPYVHKQGGGRYYNGGGEAPPYTGSHGGGREFAGGGRLGNYDDRRAEECEGEGEDIDEEAEQARYELRAEGAAVPPHEPVSYIKKKLKGFFL